MLHWSCIFGAAVGAILAFVAGYRRRRGLRIRDGVVMTTRIADGAIFVRRVQDGLIGAIDADAAYWQRVKGSEDAR